MKRWSAIRAKLENEHLAESLKGHITYFVTTYKKCPDREGRAAILLDGREIISGGYYKQWSEAENLPRDEKYDDRMHREFPYMDDTAVKFGLFDQRCFYDAFDEFDNQCIEKSLESDDILVRIFAVLDRRVGKRRLEKMGEDIDTMDESFRVFYRIRMDAENGK